jgi:2-dehydro-3-deoxyphosphogluconate aldolase/(4S)-4-hydroxy-2-oxoglutarate aldolase
VTVPYRWEVSSRIAQERLIAVIRSDSAQEAVEIGRALAGAGVGIMEVALTTPGGLDAIDRLVRELGPSSDGVLLGAGTVLDEQAAFAAITAGARFLVCPGAAVSVVRTGCRYGVPVLPGAASLSEIVAAMEAGADMVKFFPASSLGVDYLKSLRSVIPQAALVPTGGVSVANAREWLEAGAVALGVGGSLTRGRGQSIAARARELLDAIHPVKVG